MYWCMGYIETRQGRKLQCPKCCVAKALLSIEVDMAGMAGESGMTEEGLRALRDKLIGETCGRFCFRLLALWEKDECLLL